MITKLMIAFALMVISSGTLIQSQENTFNYYYRIYFNDKGENKTGDYLPGQLLSERALARRQKAGIPLLDLRDIPVSTIYIRQIISMGFELHCRSKWMNSALFKTYHLEDTNQINNLPFVKDVRIVKNPSGKGLRNNKFDLIIEQSSPIPYDRPITMINGTSLHESGFQGKGVLVAVLDGGFFNTDRVTSLMPLRSRNGIKAVYDFVKNDESVYDYHDHGTAVLSVLAGDIPGGIKGTAPSADYILLRTEDTETEFPVEEDFWAAAAEFADSIGADIISSSLGYSYFDDPSLDYKFADLDGNTTFVTQVADIAASKGILVVNSAGNERNKTWKYIIAPSDGDSVIAVGAVDGNKIISAFSSAGPSADGRIKPDLVAMGVQVPVQTDVSNIFRASGTSFSCPIITGMCASLMQAVPKAVNTDIAYALRLASDRFNSQPDTLYGYGVPDFKNALTYLQELLLPKPEDVPLIGPNPFTTDINIIFQHDPSRLKIEFFTLSGSLISRRIYNSYAGRYLKLSDLQNAEDGIYIIRLTTPDRVYTHKVIKINN